MLETPRSVFELWPSLEAVSDDFKVDGLDISASAVSKWAQRGRIGAEYWLPLVTIARRRGFESVTVEALAKMHAREPAEARA